MAGTTDFTFLACGMMCGKEEFIRSISQDIHSAALDLERFRPFTDTEAVISELIKLRGIGR